MTSAPSGMVAFLLTDIEGSSRLWEAHPVGMGVALAEHDKCLRDAISAHQGHVFATAGDSLAAAFHDAGDAVRAAIEGQRALIELEVEGEPVRVRMGVHAGQTVERDGDYFGPVM